MHEGSYNRVFDVRFFGVSHERFDCFPTLCLAVDSALVSEGYGVLDRSISFYGARTAWSITRIIDFSHLILSSYKENEGMVELAFTTCKPAPAAGYTVLEDIMEHLAPDYARAMIRRNSRSSDMDDRTELAYEGGVSRLKDILAPFAQVCRENAFNGPYRNRSLLELPYQCLVKVPDDVPRISTLSVRTQKHSHPRMRV